MPDLPHGSLERIAEVARMLVSIDPTRANEAGQVMKAARNGSTMTVKRLRMLVDNTEGMRDRLTAKQKQMIGELLFDLDPGTDPKQRGRMLQVRLHDGEYAALSSNAEKAGLTISEYVRRQIIGE